MEEILKNINKYSKEQIEGFVKEGVIDVEAVIDNLQDYDAVQIARFIRKGLIQPEDVEENYEVDIQTRKKVKKILDGNEEDLIEDDDSCFESAKDLDTIEAYNDYLRKFPNGKHRREVKELKKRLVEPEPDPITTTPIFSDPDWSGLDDSIEEVVREMARTMIDDSTFAEQISQYLKDGTLAKSTLVKMIEEDNNLFNLGVIYELFRRGLLKREELNESGIDDDFLRVMKKEKENKEEKNKIPKADNPLSIDRMSTEVYFWGVPSSGKSCVLAALMSVLKSGDLGTWEMSECKGSKYMIILSTLYKNDAVSVLLPGTPVGSTYEMGFDLTRKEGRREKEITRPFTFIDLAGGILYRMFDYVNNKSTMNPDDINTIDAVEKLIKGDSTDKKSSTNRKMHCFVIEYDADKKWEHNGLSQLEYLNSALTYIKRTKIFENKSTDCIYVIVTKVDKARKHGEDLTKEIENHVIKGYYKNFYEQLKKIAENCEINGGNIVIVPFSIGTVKMQSLCKFNSTPAKILMELFIERAKGYDTSKIGKILGKTKN